jgi:hypothetical protein
MSEKKLIPVCLTNKTKRKSLNIWISWVDDLFECWRSPCSPEGKERDHENLIAKILQEFIGFNCCGPSCKNHAIDSTSASPKFC